MPKVSRYACNEKALKTQERLDELELKYDSLQEKHDLLQNRVTEQDKIIMEQALTIKEQGQTIQELKEELDTAQEYNCALINQMKDANIVPVDKPTKPTKRKYEKKS